MSDEKEINNQEDVLKKTSQYLDSQVGSVQNIMDYVINKTQLSAEEVAESKKRADAVIDLLGDQSKYLGELLLAVCFCYDGALRTMVSMVNEQIKPASEMNLDEIATEVFQSMKKSEGTIH